MEHKLECTGCSNFCVMNVKIENGEITHLEGNCCHRGVVSAKRQLGITETPNQKSSKV